ncbi:biotin-dependent carboxyltransferase family protein [Anaerobacillus alkaliphilus]|uniref:Biotin-dependent carboxyltransferase family protein n=1 Tax=Anaerobacillus alkaliphilus TaxID=1548597 RepID=A0A4Q0VRP0_9BACI|nr:biotin-dependent carboxyltransferase family protein [Anaerobacillus alkaliphilus]RXJ00254.1 biotin-dependent carboxyltransferase family protein [Anaerobacillus alkaliphilus]
MSRAIFRIEKPGLLTTIQDLGRYGYQRYGVVVSGVMDQFAHRVGNLLVGNTEECATLEVTMMGPMITVLEDTVIAITGADLSATIDEQQVVLWKSFVVKKGQIISFGQPRRGVRAYIAAAGGFEGSDVLGSKATYIKAKMGGVAGRNLRKGDVLFCGDDEFRKLFSRRSINPELISHCYSSGPIRVILGPDENSFTKEGKATFFSGEYEITREIDRMGYRLSGPIITHQGKADIISDAITVGTIQVPASGQPIILFADRQTSGGYPRIGTVITVDIPRLVQQMSRTKISFVEISIEEAQQLLLKQERVMRSLAIAALR